VSKHPIIRHNCLSSKYKWFIVNDNAGIYTATIHKPRKVRGGYMDSFGSRFIGQDIYLIPRADFLKYGEV